MSVILITGACGEIGQQLATALLEQNHQVVVLDMRPCPASLARDGVKFYQGNILDRTLLTKITDESAIDSIFHLAAILSSGGEKNPTNAYNVNVDGSVLLLNLALELSQRSGTAVRFIFPSSIAAYGIPAEQAASISHPILEGEFLDPITMYGINKLSVEHLGRYYERYYGLLSYPANTPRIDFRCLRFPGILCAETVPSGGTSDYGPEMIHSAARGEAYECFAEPQSTLPFMTLTDAVRALLELWKADKSKLTTNVYNVGSFSVSADEIKAIATSFFPSAEISYKPNPLRVQIINSWPNLLSDQRAVEDWGWKAHHDRESTFSEYLVPAIVRHYAQQQSGAKE